jgi:plasmid stabilization system protein ParE
VTVYFSPEAEADFADVVGYLAGRNLVAAGELGRRIFGAVDRLARGQLDGPEHTLETGALVHSWPVPPVRIYYQRRGSALWIVRLYHQSRLPITR